MTPDTLDLIDHDVRTPGRLGRTLRDRRRRLGLTQADVARRAGVSPQWLSRFETNRVDGGIDRVMRLLAVLDLSVALHERPVTVSDQILRAAVGTDRI